MRQTAEFSAMAPEAREEERAKLTALLEKAEGELAKSNTDRAAMDQKLEEGWAELEKLNRAHETLECAAHTLRQELAGIAAANRQQPAGAPAQAEGQGVTAGASAQ